MINLKRNIKFIIKKIIFLIGFKLVKVQKNNFKNEIIFLHIGKCAGTQIMHICKQLSPYGINIKKVAHSQNLKDLTQGIKYFFSIRKPEDRFFSGFYSRKRKGMPRIYQPYSQYEEIAFNNFEHANQLAESLFDEGSKGKLARQAIKSIGHIGKNQFDWFYQSAFLDKFPPITIIRKEHFATDMQKFLDLIKVNANVNELITTNDKLAHKNDYSNTIALSDLAIINLKKWYVQDYFFYEMCNDWLEKN